MATYRIQIDAALHGERLDLAISKALPELSRRKVRALIDVGGVYVGGKRVRMASKPVHVGESIVVEYHPEVLKQHRRGAEPLSAAQILDLQPNYLVINKPAGMPSQATRNQAVFHVTSAIKAYLQERQLKPSKLELVHRLDKETSGVMIVARDAATLAFLSEQFKLREAKKIYWALVQGKVERQAFIESARLAPLDKEGFVRVSAQGKEATTRFRVLAKNMDAGVSLVECRPETGRSHQIRVHLAQNGLPILGDKRYSDSRAKFSPEVLAHMALHHMLHAKALTVRTGRERAPQTFEAAPPTTFQDLVRCFFPTFSDET